MGASNASGWEMGKSVTELERMRTLAEVPSHLRVAILAGHASDAHVAQKVYSEAPVTGVVRGSHGGVVACAIGNNHLVTVVPQRKVTTKGLSMAPV